MLPIGRNSLSLQVIPRFRFVHLKYSFPVTREANYPFAIEIDKVEGGFRVSSTHSQTKACVSMLKKAALI